MTSRSISITEDVYEKLDKFKLKNESFSQALKFIKFKKNVLLIIQFFNK